MKYITATVVLLLSCVANAAFIPVSQNPAETAGLTSYVGGFPTPFNSGSTAQSATTFTVNDDIRAAIMLDLTALDRDTDEGEDDYANGVLDVDFAWYYAGSQQEYNLLEQSWDQIEADVLDGFDALAFWSDDVLLTSGVLVAGSWTLHAWLEGQYYGAHEFTVTAPEPSTWFLFVFISLFIGIGKKRKLF